MKQMNWIVVLFAALPFTLIASSARADARSDALQVVEGEMAKVTRAAPRKPTFSRSAPNFFLEPEMDEAASVDAKGRVFYGFVVEQGSESIAGCVYAATSDVFITKKRAVYPVAFLQGKRVKRAAAGTCVKAATPGVGLVHAFAVPPPRQPSARR